MMQSTEVVVAMQPAASSFRTTVRKYKNRFLTNIKNKVILTFPYKVAYIRNSLAGEVRMSTGFIPP